MSVWGTSVDLAQRLEHGAAKEGEALTWADAKQAVYAFPNIVCGAVGAHAGGTSGGRPRGSQPHLPSRPSD